MKETYASDLTLKELQNGLGDLGDFTESGLSEVLGHDSYYFPVYYFSDYDLANGGYDEFIGFFIIYLKDGHVFMPITQTKTGDGFEQIEPDRARFLNENDYEVLVDSKRWLNRSIGAIDTVLESMKLKLLVNRGITHKEDDK